MFSSWKKEEGGKKKLPHLGRRGGGSEEGRVREVQYRLGVAQEWEEESVAKTGEKTTPAWSTWGGRGGGDGVGEEKQLKVLMEQLTWGRGGGEFPKAPKNRRRKLNEHRGNHTSGKGKNEEPSSEPVKGQKQTRGQEFRGGEDFRGEEKSLMAGAKRRQKNRTEPILRTGDSEKKGGGEGGGSGPKTGSKPPRSS